MQNFRSWSPEMVPDPELCCYGARVFLLRGRWPLEQHRSRLINLATAEMKQTWSLDPRGREGWLRRTPEEGLSRLRRQLQSERRGLCHGNGSEVSDASPHWPQRHAQVQQSRPRDDDRDVDGKKHHRGRAALRHLGCQRGRGIPRGRPFGRRKRPCGACASCRRSSRKQAEAAGALNHARSLARNAVNGTIDARIRVEARGAQS